MFKIVALLVAASALRVDPGSQAKPTPSLHKVDTTPGDEGGNPGENTPSDDGNTGRLTDAWMKGHWATKQ